MLYGDGSELELFGSQNGCGARVVAMLAEVVGNFNPFLVFAGQLHPLFGCLVIITHFWAA